MQSILNYVEVSPLIGTGGQPDQSGMKQLADKGYRAIVNVRTSGEEFDQAGEEKQALELGLRYYMVPLGPRKLQDEQALAFNTLLSSLKEQKVFVHCRTGSRVVALMMIYYALEEGMSVDKAEQAAKKAGATAPQVIELAKQVIARRKK